MPRTERRLHGVAGADGIVVGPVHRLVDMVTPVGGCGGTVEQDRARAALQAVAARLGEASGRLRVAGRIDEAEILEAGQLMAEDPSLLTEVKELAASRPAAAALLEATEHQAALLAAIPDPYLAARAADVRRLGRQAARLAMGTPSTTCPRGNPHPNTRVTPFEGEGQGVGASSPASQGEGLRERNQPVILVARDLGPADLAEIELDGIILGGIALAEGSVTSHAAIVARALGVPLVVGLGERALTLTDGSVVVLDGTTGMLVAEPDTETLRQARTALLRQDERRAHLARSRDDGAVTADGHRIRLLVNASTEREVLAGLAAGAEGVGLLRTELTFLDATGWPTVAQHELAVRPIFRHLAGRPVTVRTLDFGADKTPPFLRGQAERGVALQLGAASVQANGDSIGALEAQLWALLSAGTAAGVDMGLRIMLPLVERAEQVEAARQALRAAHNKAVGPSTPMPPLGAMIETRRAVEQIDAIAAAADFLSIGTNDLVQDLLGLDRLTPAATVRSAANPRVLRAIGTTTDAGRRHGRSVEVCGEAAGDPRIAILLIGLGVAELSVAPSRLDEARSAVRASTLARAADLAATALTLGTAEAVLALFDTDDPGGPA